MIAVKRNTPPRPSNRPSMTWAFLKTSWPSLKDACGANRSCWPKSWDDVPPLFGCRTNTELCRVRGWDKNLPARLLSALPKRSWIKRLRRLGLDVLIPLWRYAASKSEATRSRWQWTWVADDSVFKKYGEQLGLVSTWWRGQEHRVLSGIDGVLLVVVIGDGKLVVPVDFAIRRPDPHGPGAPCRDKLHWVQNMLDGRVAAFRRRGVALPPPMVVADSWFSDSKLMQPCAR